MPQAIYKAVTAFFLRKFSRIGFASIEGSRKIFSGAKCIFAKEGGNSMGILAADKYYLTSSLMQKSSLPYEVSTCIDDHIRYIKAAYKLEFGIELDLSRGKLNFPDGIKNEPRHVSVHVDTLRILTSPDELQKIIYPRIGRAIEAAAKFPAVRDVLDYYGKKDNLDYIDINKIIEIIVEDCKTNYGNMQNNILVSRGYISQETLKIIRDNLNNPRLSGEMARHARRPETPNEKMNYQDIKREIGYVIHKWIEDKFQDTQNG